MARIIIAILSLLYISCKKERSPAPLYNNQVNATVILMSGDTVKINAVGSKAVMGCGILGGGTFINATDEMNRGVHINIFSPNSSCVNGPGTYAFYCEYRQNGLSQSTPIYSNTFAADRGSITLTAQNGDYAEGFFYAVCTYTTDSVVVRGTFKGYMPY